MPPTILQRDLSARRPGGQGERACVGRLGFTLVEVMVVMAILSLIVLALAGVFSTTQRAFRASVTQTDVLQGSRAVMELIAADLRTATPCDAAFSPLSPLTNTNGVNFFVSNNPTCYAPLLQSLPGTSTFRTNLLQWFFVLSRQNTKWTSVGYIVNTASTNSIYPLYRYYNETNLTANPAALYNIFLNEINQGNSGFTNMSHLIDGVIHLVVRPYDLNGILMTNGYSTNLMLNPVHNTWFTPPYPAVRGRGGLLHVQQRPACLRGSADGGAGRPGHPAGDFVQPRRQPDFFRAGHQQPAAMELSPGFVRAGACLSPARDHREC